MSARRDHGASIIEFALVLPIMLVLILNVVNFAGFFSAFITVGNASRTAGDYMVLGDRSLKMPPTPPTAQEIANILSTDMSSLINPDSIKVRTCTLSPGNGSGPPATCWSCTKSGGVMTCALGNGSFTSNPPLDTRLEGGQFALAWVDVSYTYKAFIPGFNFLGVGNPFGASTTVHRQAVYRMLQ
ncbi:MAG TPA: TadE/TadG family type IV pilus assembly protein [Bryobacterales bacterium]|nr:TadE/TadG family type IV pilus assembly protein [Bryobacterales bacterium]